MRLGEPVCLTPAVECPSCTAMAQQTRGSSPKICLAKWNLIFPSQWTKVSICIVCSVFLQVFFIVRGYLMYVQTPACSLAEWWERWVDVPAPGHSPSFAVHDGSSVCHNNHTNDCGVHPQRQAGNTLHHACSSHKWPLSHTIQVHWVCKFLLLAEMSEYEGSTSPVTSASANGQGQFPSWDNSTHRETARKGISRYCLIRETLRQARLERPGTNKSDNILAQASESFCNGICI